MAFTTIDFPIHDGAKERLSNCRARGSTLLGIAISCVLILACSRNAMASDVAVVLNKNVKMQSITMSDLVKICKGDTSHWADGQALTLVILDPELPEMKVVVQKIYKLTPAEVRSLFTTANRAATNRHLMTMVDSPAELVRVVASKSGAIGLVDVYSITGAVSVLKVDDKLPLQPGYSLHGN